ncbi:MAG: putative Methicillin resistance protein [Candidatus Saccharibacteria bacterium]|jgi:lipid II:glycine glycyltransferase (peptidoglycan interpeptide bridge formation enzyme)|nr:putative Methicillin resistance protein [Candidatus Saccharibacteria bacterium]
MRLATSDELERWDDMVAGNPDGGNALQTKAWGDFKSRWGWEPRRYVYDLGERVVAAQWLVRHTPVLGEVWYCPKGPGVRTEKDYLRIVEQTKAAGLGGVLARFESELLDDDADKRRLRGVGLLRANRDPGSKSTIFIDLRPSEDEILASFNQSARRNIRKAQAGGVTVEAVDATAANLEHMFELMKATDARAHYGLRPREYFLDYWHTQARAGQGQLFLVKHEGDILSGMFATYLGERGWYKDGGSFDLKRELQASYLMQWEVMRWLKAHGVEKYDMMGVPNRDRVGKGDPRDGLYSFKSKFNPEITEFVGCQDLPLSGWKYSAWMKFGERVAAKLANRRPEKFLY